VAIKRKAVMEGYPDWFVPNKAPQAPVAPTKPTPVGHRTSTNKCFYSRDDICDISFGDLVARYGPESYIDFISCDSYGDWEVDVEVIHEVTQAGFDGANAEYEIALTKYNADHAIWVDRMAEYNKLNAQYNAERQEALRQDKIRQESLAEIARLEKEQRDLKELIAKYPELAKESISVLP
jgi:hypothetical protein